LVTVAIIVIVGLVVVSLVSLLGEPFFQNVSVGSKNLGSSSGMISISEAVVDVDGNGLVGLVNNSGALLIFTKVSVGGVDMNYEDVIMSQGEEKYFSLNGLNEECSCVGFVGEKKDCEVVFYAESEYGLEKQFVTTISVDCVEEAQLAGSIVAVQPEVNAEIMNISFNVLDSNSAEHLSDISVDCNVDDYDTTGEDSPFSINFGIGDYYCNFSKSGYDSNAVIIIADSNKSMDIYLNPWIIPEIHKVVLNLKDSFSYEDLSNVGVDCNVDDYDLADQNSPVSIDFNSGSYSCVFSKTDYDSNTSEIIVDSNKSLDIYLEPSISHIHLSDCNTLDVADGNYILDNDMGAGGECLTVTANNVTIYGNEYTITGNVNASNSTGNAYTNLAVRNCTVTESILAEGGNNEVGNAFDGGDIQVINSTIVNITAWGGVGIYSPNNGGNGGNITIIDSNVTGTINSKGGYMGLADGDGAPMTYGGDGGDVNVYNSNINDIDVSPSIHYLDGYPEARGAKTMGKGGHVTLTNSTARDITSRGYGAANGWNSLGKNGDGGIVELTNSSARHIINYGGEGADSKDGGMGGNVYLTDSTLTGDISAYGGQGGYCFGTNHNGNGGDGGNIVIIRSIVNAVSNYGGMGAPASGYCEWSGGSAGGLAGLGGNINMEDSSATTISLYGGKGGDGVSGLLGADGNAGGTLTLTDSNATTIIFSGGNGGSGGAGGAGGNGGTAILNNIQLVTTITAVGGNSSVAGGNGGNVTFDICPTPKPAVTVTGGTGTPSGADGTITPSDCHNP